jgi:cytochrome d ubiquinol oxidase subunit I
MDTLALSRLQFAVTAMFHFLFVPLTLGLGWLTAWFETRYALTGDEGYLKMTRFWGKLFLINFALGVVTGLTMEFQFGMNWAEYSKYVGDIFGAPLAIEATVAFFLESTFIGVWVFGWERLSRRAHAAAMWIVAFATNMSALWILLANGWMQRPVGYILRNNRAEMVDFWALVTNPYGWLEFFHTVFAGWVIAGFFVMGVSAWHLLRKNQEDLFRKSFGAGAVFALASSLLVFVVGDMSGVNAAKHQPAKFAAMESVWETRSAAPRSLICCRCWPFTTRTPR